MLLSEALSGRVVLAQARGGQPALFFPESQVGLDPLLCYYLWQIICAAGRRDSSLSSSPGLFQRLIPHPTHPLMCVGRRRHLSLLPRVPPERRRQEKGWAGAGWTGRAEEVSGNWDCREEVSVCQGGCWEFTRALTHMALEHSDLLCTSQAVSFCHPLLSSRGVDQVAQLRLLP